MRATGSANGISLSSTASDVNTLAATTTGGFSFIDSDGFAIGTVTALGCFTPDVTGLTAGGDIELCVETGDLAPNAALSAVGFTVRLSAEMGSVTQTIDGVITTANLGVSAQNAISLNLADNDVTGEFAASSTTSGNITFNDLGGFTVGTVTAGGCLPEVIGITATSGDVTLSTSGNLTIAQAVSIQVTGNVLLETRGASGDMVLNANVTSGTGHISLVAGDDVDLNGTSTIATTGGGTVYVSAANGTTDAITGIDMAAGTSITTGGSNVLLAATGESDIRLGLINAGSGDVSLSAERSILDSGVVLNVQADALRMVADSNSSGVGQIGAADTLNGDATANAIATQVTTRAAKSADGIYVLESDGLTIDLNGTITVTQVNFNSTTDPVTAATLSNLETTDAGPIKLVSTTGSITVHEGDADDTGVRAATTGDILLEARGAAGDIVINADVTSGSGHISLVAADDIDVNDILTTGGAGTVFLTAADNDATQRHPPRRDRDHGRRRHPAQFGRRHRADGADHQHRRRHQADRCRHDHADRHRRPHDNLGRGAGGRGRELDDGWPAGPRSRPAGATCWAGRAARSNSA